MSENVLNESTYVATILVLLSLRKLKPNIRDKTWEDLELIRNTP